MCGRSPRPRRRRAACDGRISRSTHPCRDRSGRHRAHRKAATCRRSADRDAMLLEDQRVELGLCAIFSTLSDSSSGFRRASTSRGGQLARQQRVAAEEIARAFAAMAQRDVDALPSATQSEMPTSSACIGSSDEVSVSTATSPASKAAAMIDRDRQARRSSCRRCGRMA